MRMTVYFPETASVESLGEAFWFFSVSNLLAIMGWSESQRKRLGLEKDILEKYFPGRVTWNDPTGSTTVEVRMTTNNDKNYTLKIYLPSDFPNSCPELVVSNPSGALTKRNGSHFDSMSDQDHTWDARDGHTRICHYMPAQWVAENTLYQVFMKGRIWLEAYEGHLRSGKPISDYVREMRTSSSGSPGSPGRQASSCSVQ